MFCELTQVLQRALQRRNGLVVAARFDRGANLVQLLDHVLGRVGHRDRWQLRDELVRGGRFCENSMFFLNIFSLIKFILCFYVNIFFLVKSAIKGLN